MRISGSVTMENASGQNINVMEMKTVMMEVMNQRKHAVMTAGVLISAVTMDSALGHHGNVMEGSTVMMAATRLHMVVEQIVAL